MIIKVLCIRIDKKCHSKCQNGTLKFFNSLPFVLSLLYNKAQKEV